MSSFCSIMDKNKTMLLEALCKRGIALCRLHIYQQDYEGDGDNKDGIREQIMAVWDDVLKFTEPTDTKVSSFFFCSYQFYKKN